MAGTETLHAQPLMRPSALLYFYRRRLRVHAVQELLAGLGVAIAVALMFATMLAAASISGSAREVAHAVVGPAELQLHARSPAGFPERLLGEVERLPGVRQAAPLLEQTATVQSPAGRQVTVDLAGADTSLVVLDGLAHTLPRAALSAGGIGLSRRTAQALGGLGGDAPVGVQDGAGAGAGAGDEAGTGGVTGGEPAGASSSPDVRLKLDGVARRLAVSAVLGPEAFGALARAQVAVMPLSELQRLSGLRGRVSRILVASAPGHEATVRTELSTLAAGRIDVASSAQDVALLGQALRPSAQASALFATVSGLLGVLLAFTALLLTVPERRRAIADLRLIGVKRSAIVQMLLSQALVLGVVASLVGLAGGYLLAREVLHQPTGYLAEAFTLGTGTTVGAGPLLLALGGGVLASCLASTVPLADLRRGRVLDAIYREHEAPGAMFPPRAQRWLMLVVGILLAATTLLFVLAPALALLGCVLLALAAVLAVPLTFAAALRAAEALAERVQRLTVLPVALSSLRSTAMRSLALAATGALALFGTIALGGARGDLLHGIERFAHAYSADAAVWVGTPGDNQATVAFSAGATSARIAALPGVAHVSTFQGGFTALDGRRVWIIARPPGAERNVLESQLLEGSAAAAIARLRAGGWIAISRQIAREHHAGVGDPLLLQTPSGPARLRIAATTTNLAWTPGAIFIGTGDYRRLWRTAAPTALGVTLAPGASPTRVAVQIRRALGADSGLQVVSAGERERHIDALTSEGLGQLGEISTLLLIAAMLAMATALTSATWQRRTALAALRLSGVTPRRLRAILLTESALMLGAGCLTGALAGIYGQLTIDGYLRHVTGFPLTSLDAGPRPLEVFALVLVLVLASVTVPGWFASRVSPTLALHE